MKVEGLPGDIGDLLTDTQFHILERQIMNVDDGFHLRIDHELGQVIKWITEELDMWEPMVIRAYLRTKIIDRYYEMEADKRKN